MIWELEGNVWVLKILYKNEIYSWYIDTQIQTGQAVSQSRSCFEHWPLGPMAPLKSGPDQPHQRSTKWGSEYRSSITGYRYEYVSPNMVSMIAVVCLLVSLFLLQPYFYKQYYCWSFHWYTTISLLMCI